MMIPEARELIVLAGVLGRLSRRPLDDNPHDPVIDAERYDAWAEGWWDANSEEDDDGDHVVGPEGPPPDSCAWA